MLPVTLSVEKGLVRDSHLHLRAVQVSLPPVTQNDNPLVGFTTDREFTCTPLRSVQCECHPAPKVDIWLV